MCGRGVHEKVYGELKSGFAFASVPRMRYAANSQKTPAPFPPHSLSMTTSAGDTNQATPGT